MRTFIGGKRVEQYPKGNEKCGVCGREFTCNLCGGAKTPFKCSNTTTPSKEPIGPCCSRPGEHYDYDSCWQGMPYYEDWKAGKYKP